MTTTKSTTNASTNTKSTTKSTTNANAKSLTAQAIATSIATHSTNHGAFTHMIRSLSSVTTGRAKIASAALILLKEQRATLATDKGFDSFDHYQTALQTRIDAKQPGAKNEHKNASGIKAGHKDVCNFYSLINTALKGESTQNKTSNKIERLGCASNHSPDGYKLSFDFDSSTFEVEKFVKKQPVKTAGSEENGDNSDNIDDSVNNSDNAAKTDNNSEIEVKPVFNLENAINQLENLSNDDLQTLASVLVNASDDKLIVVCSAIEHALSMKSERDSNKIKHDNDLSSFEIKASKASSELMEAKDHGVAPLVLKRLQKQSKLANENLVNCKNTMEMEARSY